jgi:hypothetical protein
MLNEFRSELRILENKSRFITMLTSGELVMKAMTKIDLVRELKEKGFQASDSGDFDYLLNMPLWSLSKDRIIEMAQKIEQRKIKITELEHTSVE